MQDWVHFLKQGNLFEAMKLENQRFLKYNAWRWSFVLALFHSLQSLSCELNSSICFPFIYIYDKNYWLWNPFVEWWFSDSFSLWFSLVMMHIIHVKAVQKIRTSYWCHLWKSLLKIRGQQSLSHLQWIVWNSIKICLVVLFLIHTFEFIGWKTNSLTGTKFPSFNENHMCILSWLLLPRTH